MKSQPPGFVKILLFFVILGSLVYGMWWLWQRQPKLKSEEVTSPTSALSKEPQEAQSLAISPNNSSVFTTQEIKLEGKVEPSSLVAIYSNNFSHVVKSSDQGNFGQDLKLENGLSLVSVNIFSGEPKEINKHQLTYFVTKDEKLSGRTVIAGSVKNIFDNIMTITTSTGEKNVKIERGANLDIPLDEEEATGPPIDAIRVGDFAISLGTLSENSQSSTSVEIKRENKPQITKKLTLAKILSTPKQNSFSAKDMHKDEILDLTIDKNTKASNFGTEVKTTDIEKNKNALIFWTSSKDKKVVDLIYLLP